MSGPPGEPLRVWKARLLAHCGIDLARSEEFGLALGHAGLDDTRSASSNDVRPGDKLALYERHVNPVAEREAVMAGLV